MRTIIVKDLSNPDLFKQQLLSWAQQFREIVFLDSNNYPQKKTNYEFLLAVDSFTSIKTDFHNAFEDLNQYQQITKDWLFGYLSYDLKNDTEGLQSQNFDGLSFPDLFFFQPKKIFLFIENQLEIHYLNMCDEEIEEDFENIVNFQMDNLDTSNSIQIHQRIPKEVYLEKISKMLEHINNGDIYEANFCMEFFAKCKINPIDKFQKLNAISKPPFAVFFKNNNHYLLSASPERYLKRDGELIVSQPIKGTSKRFSNSVEDETSKENLLIDPKERSENIMITDLVRNDLSRTAQKGTVKVEELCGIYSFLQVHHMISTITSKIDSQFSSVDLLKTTFPMGSMTGAPKISAMKIIEELEETKRGIYSGAVGYFKPNGDFVIRSILYNQEKEYVSFSVGSAITSQSIPENEYEECMLKANAMLNVLNTN